MTLFFFLQFAQQIPIVIFKFKRQIIRVAVVFENRVEVRAVVNAFVSNAGNAEIMRNIGYCIMQLFGKGVGGIYQKANVVLATESFQGSPGHGAAQAYAMMQVDILFVTFG